MMYGCKKDSLCKTNQVWGLEQSEGIKYYLMQKYALQRISTASYRFHSWKETYLHIQINHTVIAGHQNSHEENQI